MLDRWDLCCRLLCRVRRGNGLPEKKKEEKKNIEEDFFFFKSEVIIELLGSHVKIWFDLLEFESKIH